MRDRIPRVIHTCWFGGGPKSPLINRCMASWSKHLHGYTIKEWNENNFPIEKYPYVKQAYDAKKYAFCTDYLRLIKLKEEGGLYLDSDVEVVRPLDSFLVHRAFTGCETDKLWITATMGAEPNHPWINRLLEYYDRVPFDPAHPVANTRTITSLSYPLMVRKVGDRIILQDGVVIYPVATFCSFDHQRLQPIKTEESFTYHMFAGSWLPNTRSQERIQVQ